VDERAAHLNKVKAKLEQTLDEIVDSLNREKKTRSEVEKAKRRVEADVKLTQEAVADLERNKKELESLIFKRDAECASLASRFEEEQVSAGRVGKSIKELHAKIEEIEDEIK
ncbi:unnamed protein product, partial [Meganyctiphanes norvegica]